MATIQPDESEYGGQTVTGAAWPQNDEDELASAAKSYEDLAKDIRDEVIPGANRQRMKLADAWEGAGANAAIDEAGDIVASHSRSERAAKDAATKLRRMEFAVAVAKALANQTAERVQNECAAIWNEGAPEGDEEDTRQTRIAKLISDGREENERLIEGIADQLSDELGLAPDGEPGHADDRPSSTTPVAPALQDGWAPNVPASEPGVSPGAPAQPSTDQAGWRPELARDMPAPAPEAPRLPPDEQAGSSHGLPSEAPKPAPSDPPPRPVNPDSPTAPSPIAAAPPSTGGPGPSMPSSGGSAKPQTAGPVSPAARSDSPASVAPGKPAGASNPNATGLERPGTPVDQFQKGLSEVAKTGATPQPTASHAQPLGTPSAAQPLTPPSGPQVPASPTPNAAHATASGSLGGSGAGLAPVAPSPGGGGVPLSSPVPLGPPPTPPPAAPVTTPPLATGAPVAPTGAAAGTAGGGAQVAPIPVSAARAERDLAQRAVRRSGVDPMENARRIAAALNAPGMTNDDDFMFFWITALTVDGKVVVANNYGLAYIPEQVRLPQQVHMASADESISPADRASWVNHPIVAVQRWAQHHDTELRAVIATEDQLQHTDAGVHHEILRPEDIPANGRMAGRDRLQVIAPHVADQLSRVADGDLVKVLPPAPADENPPEDRRLDLWDEVWQPLTSRAPNTGAVHLQAFLAYAVHAQEHAIHAAHTAADPETQRRSVGDFIYWQHVGQLVADAIAA